VQTVEVKRCQNIRYVGYGDIKFGKQLDFSPSDARINVKHARDRCRPHQQKRSHRTSYERS
jgi:hypothetical protein